MQVKPTLEAQVAFKQQFVSELSAMPVAINTDDANEQHYEVRANGRYM